MKTIAITGQKGGTGKTTLAQILLVAFEQDGFTTAGIDLDPQTSLCTWGDARGPETPAIIPMQANRLLQTLDAAKDQGVDIAIIDTAGRAEGASMAAAKAADLVIIPVQPTTADLMTVENALSIVELAKTPKRFSVLTRVKAQGERHVEAADGLKALGIKVCPHHIGDRVAYQDAAASGLVPMEFEPGGKSALESQQVYMFTCREVDIKGDQR